MNFTYLVIALIASYGIKESLIALDIAKSDWSRIIGALNAFLCVVALANYERWLV